MSALLEREETETLSRTTPRRSSPVYYDRQEDYYSPSPPLEHRYTSDQDEDLESPAVTAPPRTPATPSRHRENPQPIVGTARFDTTSVNAIDRSAGGGSAPPDGGDEPPDDDPEERFGDPIGYFSELEDLEEDIAHQSSLELYRSNNIIGDFELDRFPTSSVLRSIVTQSDDTLVDLCRNASASEQSYARTVIHLLRCRGMMFAVYANCEKLIAADFGGRLINFLRVMQGRKSVAELVSYKASSIKHLAEEFDHALSRYLYQTFLSRYEIDPDNAEDALRELNKACDACLQDLGLWDWEIDKQRPEFLWYCISQALDLAVLSFAGAHSQDFSRYIGKEDASFDVPGPFLQLPIHFTMRQRHLQCLDSFFGGAPVWVFHPRSMGNVADEPLYLSTNMRDFSHIWGPVWGISTSGNLDVGIKRYDVGGGSIYPWPIPRDGPKLLEEEVFCHWLPVEETWKAAQISKLLKGDDTLLIGAIIHLERNNACETAIQDLELQLHDSNSLHDLRTSESSYYVDSTTSGISLGGWGFNVSGQRSFKRRDGQTLKSALLERWSHERDGSRMILDLVKGYGLEMSFCSLNAQRTRLIDLLKTKSMMGYLKNCDWDDERRQRKFFEVLGQGTIDDLLRLYKENRSWRKDIQSAILLALRILAEFAVDDGSRDLSIPWILRRTAAHAATFKSKNISWAGFLRDRRDTATFGLLVNKCLSFKEEGCRTCGQTTGKPVLQTLLHINRKMRDSWMKLQQRPSGEYFWSISALYKKFRFPLGSQGSLTTRKVVKGALLVEWASEGVTKEFFKKAIHWNEGMHHQEFIGAKWNAMDYPIRIFIESKHAVQGGPNTGPNKLKKRYPPASTADFMTSTPSPTASLGGTTLGASSERSHETQTSGRPRTYSPDSEDLTLGRSAERLAISRSRPSAPAPRPGVARDTSRDEVHSDLGSDDEESGTENGWKWDKKFNLWRRHVYTDGVLDYTTWSKNPEQTDGR